MSIARHHNEWLSLTEVSGPFLSLPVLLKVFPQGLDAHDPDHLRDLRLAHGEWEVNLAGPRPDPAIHTAWIRFVLGQTLEMPDDLIAEGQAIAEGLKAVVAEHGETLRPDLVVKTLHNGKARLVVQRYPSSQDLNKPVADKRWKASPATRMTELLHGTDVRLGLVTNGEHWMLVNAPRGDTSGFISWYATLWQEEHITLRAFRSLLCVRRFFGVPDNETPEAMLAESAENQQEVTDRLGYQVRRAVEVLVQSLDQADRDHGGDLLADVSEVELYNASLTIMMRLVFLFCAEERGLLLLGDPIFDQHYAVSTLRAQLRDTADQHGEEILERRLDAWCRLLATFRAVHGGVQHEAMRLMAYGGHLFDPDRFPFLEGRKQDTRWQETAANPLPVNNRTVLHLLESLQILEIKVPGGGPPEARRLSFRALDIEQIGHVYEGLLDHTAKRATEPTLSLKGAKYEEPEIRLSALEDLRVKGEKELLKFLKDQTKRSVKALKRVLDAEPDLELSQRLRVACGNDEKVYARVAPFSGLIREDTFGNLVVIPEGSVYVTAGTDRRTTGTHYTPRSLTEPIVQYTLEPLVYVGPAEGKPKEQWKLQPAAELLKLKICDMAMGSGAFLVQACRYMSERLVESWEEIEAAADGRVVVTPEGDLSTGSPDELPIPRDAEERLAIARRIVADRCLYGVDINPMAVEMAKLSLWLITLDKHRPFTFLDHAFKCGDSLVGISNLKQLETFSFDGEADVIPTLLDPIRNKIEIACILREQLEALPSNTLDDIAAKDRKNNEANEHIARLRYVADMLTCAEFEGGSAAEREKARHDALYQSLQHFADDPLPELARAVRKATAAVGVAAAFQWPLEFPEVFERGGFDAFICNPPFMGGFKLEPEFGARWRAYVVERIAHNRTGVRGAADLCAYFMLRSAELLRSQAMFGMLGTNTVAQGDTRAVCLDHLLSSGCTIIRAASSFKWPGAASIESAYVTVCTGSWRGLSVLNESQVPAINAHLDISGEVHGAPARLAANEGKAFKGATVMGMGFILEPAEATALIEKDARNKDVLFPYLNGQDLNSRPDQSASRWAINFFDWPMDRRSAPKGYDGPVAADYPDCLSVVTERVRSERSSYKPTSSWNRSIRTYWWRFGLWRPALYAASKGLGRVVVKSEVGNMLSFAFVPNDSVFSHMLIVFPVEHYWQFSILQSTIHECWARNFGSSMRTDLRYTPVNCFGTFPFPENGVVLETVAEMYHSYRSLVMNEHQEGLTKTYNRVHDHGETSQNIQRLRELHIDMDHPVAAAYGWDDLDLGHGFHETKQGIRFTISESARREVLARLLKLNHERYAEEVAQGLHDKKGKAKKSASRKRAKKKESAAVRHTGKLIED